MRDYKHQKKWQVKATTADAPRGKLPVPKDLVEYEKWCKRSEARNTS